MLLDVNVLLALAWPNHQHHGHARGWFERQAKDGWSTCAITQLGFIRISSNPAFTTEARSPLEASRLLAEMTALEGHTFLEALPAPAGFDAIWRATLGHRQTTDVYLAALAAHHGTLLATFDRKCLGNPAIRGAVHLIELS
jgi:toxin-antitoxin system PIN domain toxin